MSFDLSRKRITPGCLLGLLVLCSLLVRVESSYAAETPASTNAPWAAWMEPNFPFFSSVVDARKSGAGSPTNNLTPRGLVVNLGHDCWACFDVDLLRVSAMWEGKPVTWEAGAPLSYYDPGQKTIEGQNKLPVPDGKVWIANGIYPGWQTGAAPVLTDPRSPAPSPEEVGRGGLPLALGRFDAVRLTQDGLRLEYTVSGTKVSEQLTAVEQDGARVMERRFQVAPSTQVLWLVLGLKPEAGPGGVAVSVVGSGKGAASLAPDPKLWAVQVPAHSKPVEFVVALTPGTTAPKVKLTKTFPEAERPSAPRWPQVLTTKTILSTAKDAYVLDDVQVPLDNPWRRSIRLLDVEFFRDGTAAGVTLDGDVWLIRGLGSTPENIRWKRFASGLHEPMSLAIRDEQIYVYDRNGIWRLRDTNGDDEADVHELFSNVFAQTAETREFPSSMKLAPDGSFVISKGGQQGSTRGKHNGMVLRVSADGNSVQILGWGFRQPFVGVNPRTGMVTASDQEGNYVPTTPLYIVKDDEYHAYLSGLVPKEKYPAPIVDPLTWIPHPVNASATTQVWLDKAKMGPLNGSLIHLAYTRPEIFRVLLNNRQAKPQAAVVSLTRNIDFALFNGAVNPADGQLYVTGFRGWGTIGDRLTGLVRVRYTGAPSLLPSEVTPMDKGVLLRFDTPLDPKAAADLGSYSVERWNYRRSWKYGSPHLKPDGQPGQEWMPVASAYLSHDGKSVFLGIPDMKPVMQMRVGWSLASADGTKFDNNAYFTPYELTTFVSKKEGFDDFTVDLSPKNLAAKTEAASSVEEGIRLAQLLGCAACHSTDGSMVGRIGPTWKGLFGKEREFSDRTKTIANEDYIRQSIQDPGAKIVRGYEKNESGMPNYSGVVTDAQIESLILYIKSLK